MLIVIMCIQWTEKNLLGTIQDIIDTKPRLFGILIPSMNSPPSDIYFI